MRQSIRKIADLSKVKNGLIDALFVAEMNRITQDLIDRPGLGNARKLCVEVCLEPVCGQSGHLESITARFEVCSKVPKQCTDDMSMLCGDGALTFNDLSPEDVHQRTLDES